MAAFFPASRMNDPGNKPVGDIALAVVMIGLAGAVFIASFGLPEPALEPIGPAAFPFAASAILFVLSVVILWRVFTGAARAKLPPGHRQRADVAILTIALTVAYFLTMEFGLLSFRWATVGYVFVLTMLLFDWQPRKIPVAVMIGLVMGIGLKFTFTEVLYLDLP